LGALKLTIKSRSGSRFPSLADFASDHPPDKSDREKSKEAKDEVCAKHVIQPSHRL
jgi:hypothetical protein